MHYHMSVFGQFDGSWQQAENYYKQILREEERVNFITVLREPRKHLLRYRKFPRLPAGACLQRASFLFRKYVRSLAVVLGLTLRCYIASMQVESVHSIHTNPCFFSPLVPGI